MSCVLSCVLLSCLDLWLIIIVSCGSSRRCAPCVNCNNIAWCLSSVVPLPSCTNIQDKYYNCNDDNH